MAHDPFFLDDARRLARANTWFRQVVYTGEFTQVVLMSIPPGGEIGDEMHEGTDQMFVIVEGEGDAILAGKRRTITGNDLIVVRAGTRHNIRNTASSDLKLVTIYAPPAHAEGTIHRTREDAVGAMIRSERAYS